MSVVSHAQFGATQSAAPPSVASHAHARALPVSPSAFRTPSAAPPAQQGPIHLRKDNFPLLHSLLDSAEYREAITKQPELNRRPTARRSSDATAASAVKAAKRKPLKSGTGVADLWSKVPRALGTASSVAGSLRSSAVARQRQPKQSAEWEVVDGEDAVETMQDQLWTSSVGRSGQVTMPPLAGAQSSLATLSRSASQKVRVPLFPSTSAAAPPPLQTMRTAPAIPTVPVLAKEPTSFPLASQSLPDLPQTANLPPIQTTFPTSYPSRPLERDSLAASPTTPRSRPSTTFHSAVSQLKRMLTRSSRPTSRQPRSSLSPSIGSQSAFSASTIFGGGGGRSRTTSGLSMAYSLESGYIDLGGEAVVASPMSYAVPQRTSSEQPRRPTSMHVPLPVDTARPASSALPAAAASTLPRAYPPRRSSLLASSSSASLSSTPSALSPASLPTAHSPLSPPPPSASRALSPRPAGRLAASTPLSAARRTTDLEAWRDSRRLFLQVLRDGPAGASPSPAPPAAVVAAVQKAEQRRGGVRWKAGLLGIGSSGSGGGAKADERRPRSRLREAHPPTGATARPASISTFSTLSVRSTNGRASIDAQARYWAASPSSPSFPASAGAAPPLERARTLEDLSAPPPLSPAGATAGYWSYGSRWEGAPSAPLGEFRGRRSLSVRRAGRDEADGVGEGSEEEKVWSKWRKWVRERREAIRRER
ncbi:hypothetical protein JCM10449v2_006993 [Rhodotorula kratochvilovae]